MTYQSTCWIQCISRTRRLPFYQPAPPAPVSNKRHKAVKRVVKLSMSVKNCITNCILQTEWTKWQTTNITKIVTIKWVAHSQQHQVQTSWNLFSPEFIIRMRRTSFSALSSLNIQFKSSPKPEKQITRASWELTLHFNAYQVSQTAKSVNISQHNWYWPAGLSTWQFSIYIWISTEIVITSKTTMTNIPNMHCKTHTCNDGQNCYENKETILQSCHQFQCW